MSKNRSVLAGGTLVVLAVLFVAAIVLSNVLFRGWRIDLTENDLYTLSDGTKRVLAEIPEPINLYFYFSEDTASDRAELQPVRDYATRVREMLEEMAALSGGKIRLQVVDPLPFSEEEDKAASYGLQAIPITAAGENIYFGLAGTNSTDGQMIVPFFQPDKEAFLEYDVAKLIHGLSTSAKPKVAFISGLEMAPGFDPATRQVRQGWAVYTSLSELFDVKQITTTSPFTIEKDVGTLVVVHPKALPDDALYAIDQFVLRGGKLALFVDPHAELDQAAADPENPQAAMFADRSSDVAKLFKAWGVEYDKGKVLLDAEHALPVQAQQGAAPVRHLAILGMNAKSMSQDDVVTAQLESVNFSSAGVIRLAQDSPLTLVPLIQSSGESMLAASDRLKFLADPSELFRDFVASNDHYVLAGRLRGKLKTAFPERTGEGHLAESSGDVDMIVVADTDVLSDRLWVQVGRMFDQTIMNAFASNGDFAVNAIDNLTGSSALISVRGRATSSRPFTTVEALRRTADDKYRATERELNEQLAETERKLNELQSGKSAESALILSPEQKAEIDSFQKKKVDIRKKLRGVRRELDADIERLGTSLKLINILLVPLLVVVAALGFWWQRRRRVAVAQ